MNSIQELIKQYAETHDKEYMLKIIEELQQRELLWSAYSPVTRNHYIEIQNGATTAYVFSEIGFCNAFKDYLKTNKISIEPMECESSVRASLFSDFFRNGIEQVIIDNGQMFVMIELSDIINLPDFSHIPANQRPVMNPKLMKSANYFFQCQQTGEKNPNAQSNFMRDIFHAKYLLPLVMDNNPPKGTSARSVRFGDSAIDLAVIGKPDGSCYIPVFTDWIEFSKMDRDMVCVGNVVSFSDIQKLCESGEMVTINPLGFNMLMDKTTVRAISTRYGTPEEEQKTEQIGFFELNGVPEAMLKRLNELLDQTDGIHNAYLKGMRKDGVSGYLCIVDFTGTNPAVFQQMAQQVGPLTGGVPLNFINYNSEIGRAAVQNTLPFYQRMKMS